jgi:hypothetical protein
VPRTGTTGLDGMTARAAPNPAVSERPSRLGRREHAARQRRALDGGLATLRLESAPESTEANEESRH